MRLRRTLVLLLHLAAVLLPMLAGWGLADLHEFSREPARAWLLNGILFGACVLFVLGIDLNPLHAGEFKRGRQGAFLLGLALASILLLGWLPFADRTNIGVIRTPWVRWLGLSLCGVGGAVRVLALCRLGAQFSAYVTLQSGHDLIEDGVYAIIRHPLYLSLLLAAPGLALVFRSQLVFPIALATLIFVSNRIYLEERLLAAHFGARFSGYQQRTWSLIPLLY